MLYSVELRLAAVQGTGKVTGYHAYSFLLHLIEGVNPTLAARLHEDGGPKPFTLSLPVPADGGARRNSLQEGARARLHLTFMEEETFASLLDAVWRWPSGVSLPLGSASVTCQGLATTPAQSPWASFTSFQQLLESAGEERKLRLAFLSPTTFRSKGERNILFPEPALVFGSLLARWNAFAPSQLSLDLGKAIASQVRLSGYRLATRMLDFGSYQELGFLGQATYELGESLSGSELRALQALGAFAFFSGIGAKTTMGMGQARRLDNARPLSHRAGSHAEEGRRPAAGN